jgi:hypothetical protein
MSGELAAANVGRSYSLAAPSFVLFSIGLIAVASIGLALWLSYLLFVIRDFPKVHTPRG